MDDILQLYGVLADTPLKQADRQPLMVAFGLAAHTDSFDKQ